MTEPQYSPLIGFARPWSPGTNGPITGEPVLAPIHTEADFEKFKGKLKGKIVLLETPRPSSLITTALAQRLTDTELAAEALAPDPSPTSPFFSPIPRDRQGPPPTRVSFPASSIARPLENGATESINSWWTKARR